MEREVGGGIGMGNTCKSMADSFQCMTKPTTIKKKKDLVHMHDGIFAIKQNEVPFVVTWTDPEMIILSEVSQTGQDKYHMISLICRV